MTVTYRGYTITSGAFCNVRHGYQIDSVYTDDWELEGVPVYRTISRAKKAIDAIENGTFVHTFPTKRYATQWRDDHHCKWSIKESGDGNFEVRPSHFYTKLHSEVFPKMFPELYPENG